MTMINLQDVANAVAKFSEIPDKSQWKTTTSHVFKLGLAQVLSGKNKLKWIEIGAAQGHTTHFLSSMAKTIFSIDIDKKNCEMIEGLGHENVTVADWDLYSSKFEDYMKKNNFDAAVIDAIHDEHHANIDIQNCINAGVKTFVFDDYGAFAGVKKAVDDFISSLEDKNTQYTVSYIGMPPGTLYPNTQFQVLSDWEGIVIQIKEEK